MSTLETLEEFQNFECQNPINVALSCRVYQDLQKTKKYSKLSKSYSADLDIIYLTAIQGEVTHVFMPLNISQACNMSHLERIQSKLKQTHKESVMHLAICDTASNVLYYTITSGFVDKPENWHKKV